MGTNENKLKLFQLADLHDMTPHIIDNTWYVGEVNTGISANGIKGDKGDTGAKGIPGDTGTPGAKGDTGATGARGLQGLPGDKGDIGATGAKGDTGERGLQGIPGDKGAKGDTGARGIQGLPGADGAKGDAGARGIQGLPGADGAKGDTGARGLQGIPGEKGEKGEKGDTGARGLQGVPGEKGEKGEKGDTGARGLQGVPGADGRDADPATSVDTLDSVNQRGNVTSRDIIVEEEKSGAFKTVVKPYGVQFYRGTKLIASVGGTVNSQNEGMLSFGRDGYNGGSMAPQKPNRAGMAFNSRVSGQNAENAIDFVTLRQAKSMAPELDDSGPDEPVHIFQQFKDIHINRGSETIYVLPDIIHREWEDYEGRVVSIIGHNSFKITGGFYDHTGFLKEHYTFEKGTRLKLMFLKGIWYAI